MLSDDNFIHLHNHSVYSIQDSLLKIDDLLKKTKEYNLRSVALTDHGSMCGISEFNVKSKGFNIKPIFGCEIYVQPLYEERNNGKQKKNAHLILLAKNKIGYENLIKIHNNAWRNFYYKPRTTYQYIKKHSQGLICMTACLGGDLYGSYKKDKVSFEDYINYMKEIFNDDFYLELQDISKIETKELNKEILKTGEKFVITNDIHYMNKEDYHTHNILILMRDKKTLKDLQEGNAFSYGVDDLYYKSPKEIKQNYSEETWQKCLYYCNEIYEKIEKIKILDRPHLPIIDENPEKTIKKIIYKNKHKIPKKQAKIYYKRLKEEMDVFKVTNSLNYLLIVKDFMDYGKSKNYLFNYGRGSACSSLVAYLLGIHDIDPIENKLFFKRFLNEYRGMKMKVFK